MSNPIPFPGGDRLPDPEPVQEAKKPREKIILDERGLLDLPFLLLTVLLVVIGVIMMFSASYASAYAESGSATKYFSRQGLFALVGFAIMLFVSRVNYQLWRSLSIPIYIVTMVIMFLVPIIGIEEGGAKRWIYLGFTNFQPSEVAKVSLIMIYAAMISTYKDKMKTFSGLWHFVLILGILLVSLVFQHHLSAMVIVTAVAVAMLFLGGVQIRYFVIGGVVLGLLAWLYVSVMGYAGDRITAWLDPWSDPQGTGYQIIQSLYAIGSGGLMGLGLGRGRQKYLYLPEEHNDYIFPIVCEELGFVGAVVVILLFVLLIIRGYWIAIHARDRFGSLLVSGIITLFALQVFFNIGVVTNFLPATGISLPFFSYGITALLLQMFEIGIVLSVSRQCDNQLLL